MPVIFVNPKGTSTMRPRCGANLSYTYTPFILLTISLWDCLS
ncbi:MAG: hypothetical protein J7J99_05210 [Thermoprotei archaeon]|nr:hypothetical protein [Thermoprotei archaeon]